MLCKKCGGLVDPETKKCTECGKQYFKLPKNILRKSIVALLFLAMAGGLVYLYMQNQALAQELDEKTKEASKLENLYYYSDKSVSDWKEKYYAEKEKYLSIYDEYEFYHEYAVIVQEGVTNYHSYGCPRLDYHYFWIYNIDAAEGLDYDPCPKCQFVEDRSDWTIDDYRDELEAINDIIDEMENAG